MLGGTPGIAGANSFVGDSNAGADGGGFSALLEDAAGTSDTVSNGVIASFGINIVGGSSFYMFIYQNDPGAGGIHWKVETSPDLVFLG